MSDDQGNEVYRDENSVNIEFIMDPNDPQLDGLYRAPSPDKPLSECGGLAYCDAPPPFAEPDPDYGKYYYSDICIGGGKYKSAPSSVIWNWSTLSSDGGGSGGATGANEIEPMNSRQDSGCGRMAWDGDAGTACEGLTPRMLGVFPGTLNFTWYNLPPYNYPTHIFRKDLDPVNGMYTLARCNVYDQQTPAPCLPIGEHPLDPTVLDPTFDRTAYSAADPEAIRHDQIMRAIEGYAKMYGTLTSHELGHSLGVSVGYHNYLGVWPPSYPPYHAFGGYPPFTGSYSNHLVLTGFEPYGYFPGPGAPIMSNETGFYLGSTPNTTSFTSFDKAYLLERTFYTNNDYPYFGCRATQCTDLPHRATCYHYAIPGTTINDSPCVDQCPAR